VSPHVCGQRQEKATWPAMALIGIVRVYRLTLSPLLGARCRYYPSCSAYAMAALKYQGALRGVGLTIWRLLRCNPWSRGGVDYAPGDPAGDGWIMRSRAIALAQPRMELAS
jgi:putative membrane protein insertion efficiency factor